MSNGWRIELLNALVAEDREINIAGWKEVVLEIERIRAAVYRWPDLWAVVSKERLREGAEEATMAKGSGARRCECAYCGAELYRIPALLELHSEHYCNRACKDAAQVKYSDSDIEYIKENIGLRSIPQMAGKLGVTPVGLQRKIDKLRRQGVELLKKRA
jgi:hypothetical protein